MSFNQKGQTKKLLKFLKKIENPCCDCPDISKDEGNVIECRSDGLYAPEGGPGYTDEQAQDAVGSILNPAEFTYNDATPVISINEIDWSKIINAPAFLDGAENGVSLDGSNVVLGQSVGAVGDPGQLLSNREIPLKGFSFTIGEGGDNHLFINPTALVYGFGALSTGNGSQIGIDDGNQAFDYQTDFGHLFNVNSFSGNASLGDLDFNSTGFQMFLDYSNQHFSIFTGPFPGSRFFDLDRVGSLYQMGDIDNAANNTMFFIDDANTVISASINGYTDPGMYIQINAGLYMFGDSSGNHNGNAFIIEDSVGSMRLQTNSFYWLTTNSTTNQVVLATPGDANIVIDGIANTVEIGDSGSTGNGTTLEIDDINNEFDFKNTANTAIIRMNGVAGFTGTVNPVTSITVVGGIVTAVS